MPPDEAAKVRSIFLQIASNKEVIKDLENWNIGKNGDKICLLTNGVPILDEYGNFKGYRGVDKDITARKRMEEALLYERSLLKALMDNSPDHIYFKDIHSRFLRMSKSHAEIFGLSNPAEAEGKTDLDFFTEEHARPAFVDEQEIIKTGIPKVNKEEKETWPDSPDTWVSTSKMPLQDMQGNIIGTFGISRDITASKQAEFQILKLNRTYSVLSNINKLIVRERNKQKLLEDTCNIAVEDGKFTMCWIGMVDEEAGKINPVAYAGKTGDYIDHLDISTSDISSGKGPTGTAFRDNKHVICNNIEQDEQMLPWRNRALALGYSSSAAFPLHIATRVMGVINFYSSEVNYFDGAEIALLDELAMDISFALQTIEIEVQHRQAGEALATERNLLRILIDAIPDCIFVKDTNARFILNNKAHLQVLGVKTQEECLGKTDYDFRPKDLSDKFSVSDQKVLQTGESIIGLEEQFISASAHISWILSTKVPLYDTQGNIIGLVGTSHDVTDKKKTQSQLLQSQKVQSIGTLAGGIAHDFNNILGIILAYSSVLERVSKDQLKFAESIKSINSAVSRGAALVRQILTFARQTDVAIKPMSVPELAHEVVTMLQETFPKIFEFKEIFERGIPFIQADHSQMHQAILNLCVNARDAMPRGGVITIKIETCPLEKIVQQFPGATYDRYVCLSVSDTGTGIDEATKSRVFDPFFTTKELGKGTGLGLSVVYGIMQSHYGFVSVESEVGKGTTFYLYLPMPQEPRKVREEQKKELFELRGGTETILFVEDEELLRTAVQSELESSGYKVYSAVDGREAIEIYKQHENEISLILTDMGLPKKSGIDVFQQVREINPKIKIVLASGFIALQQKSELLEAGANGFIQKPYMLTDVLQKIREVLDEK
jgi:PAS domain S-box-containing protein